MPAIENTDPTSRGTDVGASESNSCIRCVRMTTMKKRGRGRKIRPGVPTGNGEQRVDIGFARSSQAYRFRIHKLVRGRAALPMQKCAARLPD